MKPRRRKGQNLMSSKRKAPVAIRSSESQMAKWVAQLFGVYAYDKLSAVLEDAVSESQVARSLARDMDPRVYGWEVDVASTVMSGDMERNDLLYEVICSRPAPLLVRDTQRSGLDSLWAVMSTAASDFPYGDLPYRALVNHVKVGDITRRIIAIHLRTCFPND